MSKIIDHSTYAPECTCCDDWHTCTRCGADKGNLDLWQAYCDRCAELERLEREIGRATIGIDLICRCIDLIEVAAWKQNKNPDYEVIGKLIACRDLLGEKHDRLYARWRQLHAGAEGER